MVSVLVVVREEPQQAPAQGWGWDGVSELLLPSSGGAMGGGPGSCQASRGARQVDPEPVYEVVRGPRCLWAQAWGCHGGQEARWGFAPCRCPGLAHPVFEVALPWSPAGSPVWGPPVCPQLLGCSPANRNVGQWSQVRGAGTQLLTLWCLHLGSVSGHQQSPEAGGLARPCTEVGLCDLG